MDDFDLRVDRAALAGLVTHTDTLAPLVAEAVNQAASDLDATEKEIKALDDTQQQR